MFGSISNTVQKCRQWKKTVWDEKPEQDISLKNRLFCARHGFTVNEYYMFRLDENDYRDYLSEYERLESRTINGEYKFILDNKLVFEEVFSKYIRVPKNYAWINNGKVYGLHGLDVSNSSLIDWLKEWKKTVLKWIDRGGGAGTYVIEYDDNGFILNYNLSTEEEILHLIDRKGKALICEYISQGSFPKSLYPYSTNTLRIICAKKKGEDFARAIAAVQRIGCEASKPVDNVSHGGLTAEVDLETGELDDAFILHGEENVRLKAWQCHPDTGTQIKGLTVPDWQEILKQMEDLTNAVPYLNFVAWDVLLTDEGICVIEGNASSGVRMFQMKNGRKYTALGDIFRSYGIIK